MKTYLLTLHEVDKADKHETFWNEPVLVTSAHSIERLAQHARESDLAFDGNLTTILLPGEQLPPGSQDQSFWEITEVPFLSDGEQQ